MNAQIALLALCQGLFLTTSVTFFAVAGLVGLDLAPQPALATLPYMGYMVCTAISTRLVARHQLRFGRRRGFQLGLVSSIVASLLCAVAIGAESFPLYVAGAAVSGYYAATTSLYRFAAVELALPGAEAQAISWVLLGGILGAIVGPNLAIHTRELAAAPFLASHLVLVGVAVLGVALLSIIRFPALEAPSAEHPGRSARELARQPEFVIAIVVTALGYGLMNLLMLAAPIAMHHVGHHFSSSALVIEWHVLGMFVPSFFSGTLVRRFGVVAVLVLGVLCNVACIGVALSGESMLHFGVSMTLLGVGWNFLFVGGSTLLTATYRPHEKVKAQATMDLCTFSTMAVTALSAGLLVDARGWQWINWVAVPLVVVVAVAIGWLVSVHRTTRAAEIGGGEEPT